MFVSKPILAAASTLILAFTVSAAKAADEPNVCDGTLVPVSGKILNNALGPGETLGSVHLTLGPPQSQIKLKCGLHGTAYFVQFDPSNPLTGLPRFTHKMVCDDTQPVPGSADSIHSQAILDTHFTGFVPGASCGNAQIAFSFTEVSYPLSGRGLLSPTGGGFINVKGVAQCSGAIDMLFTGNVCLKQ